MTTITNARIRAFIIISITVAIVLLLLASAGNATNQATQTREYRVQLGDTLWEIAAEHGPEGVDRRRVVDAIERINGVDPATLQAGQVIEIPVIPSS
jgi:Tfp pilus assembly protein FimV